ncbi:uncharacterized protein LOC122522774 [Polistes fuscatus]|uniref:uncharacterized protein LOC122522774 n=1 Tax=Polistes fuscatus TaxID=30207 RepID=UPI001CA8A83E|nr:uncharacterized protein LOC122522774 [Polistes fuscatus]XP_043499982.1 uncharacterized protein LOC122522774 [Polistes fuscatus]XP_043499983.1 uncharacterized protein LOC122522774 [Polistes fuscatus]XP_043499984.1 uncharacterized protein LOC122522774 [Polistes fuscatus]XP_043499985.1 uncharacterized protein LOC122522774 [Polistes fuscatus]XP_043499986.1 uncharacterized protein LOC122522774 [Polistes fuscatus]XP_043499987.1 uncharacterized protein LOC122522774 [Polistes fuscatus]XP_04349998
MSSCPKGNIKRSTRLRKRKFYANQDQETDQNNIRTRKFLKINNEEEDIHYNSFHGYRLIEFFTVFTALAELVICRNCKHSVRFDQAGNRGLGFKIVLICSCGRRDINSGPLINNTFEVNRRIVLVMRLLGIAKDGINLFCNFMDMCDGLSEAVYNNIITRLHDATKSIFQSCCKKAVEKEKEENEKHNRPIFNLKVSGDGSWKKQGYRSSFSITTLIGCYSGKVIDLVIKSSRCPECSYWKSKENTEEYREGYEGHMSVCQENDQIAMEIESIKEMFLRSEELFGVKYSNYVEDGDSKTFQEILDINPYGNNFQVVKSEFLGYVQKKNESFNSTVWSLAPNHILLGLKIIEIVAYIATGLFNEGYTTILQVMNKLDIIIGRQCKSYVDKQEERKVAQKYRRSLLEARGNRQLNQSHQEEVIVKNEFFEATEELLHDAEIAN